MQALANEVYKNDLHKPKDPSIRIDNGAYKNKLHSYIKSELNGSSNEDLQKFAIAAIELAEKSIDLANNLTHNNEATKLYAESCVVGGFAVISVVKSIEENKA